MLSSDENIERIADFVQDAKEWIMLKKEYTTLGLTEKVVRVLTALVMSASILVLVILALIYLSFAVAYYLGESWNSMPLAFLAVGAFYLFILLLVAINRHAWVEQPLVRFILSLLQDNHNNPQTPLT